MTYAGNIASSQSAPQVKQEFFDASIGAAQKLTEQRKNDARLELFLGSLYAQFGQLNDALAHTQKALELSPGKQQIMFQLGLTYLNLKENDKALETFKAAYLEAPEDDQALVYYAAGEYLAGNTAAGDKILTDKYGTTLVDNDQLVQVYNQAKLYDRVIAIWKMRVEKSPKDLNTNLGLASAYYQAGHLAEAIDQLKKMQQIDPSKAAQIQTLIDQLVALTGKNIKIGR